MSRRGLRAEVEKEKEVATALLTGNAARDLAEVAKRIALPEADASYILKVKTQIPSPLLFNYIFSSLSFKGPTLPTALAPRFIFRARSPGNTYVVEPID